MKKTVLNKISAFGICAVLIVGMLTGCNSETVKNGEFGNQTEQVSAEIPESDDATSEIEETSSPEPVKSDKKSPIFSVTGGILTEKTALLLTLPEDAPAGAVITYTVDSCEPTAESSRVNGEIYLLESGDCKVIRAAVFTKDGELWGEIATNVYIYSGTTNLRIVSLVSDPDDLYGENYGILSNRSGTGREWERPCYVTVIEPDGTVPVAQYAGVRLAGAGSRTFNPASFRITARKSESLDESGEKYIGGGSFKANLFEGCSLSVYDGFILRNGGNDAISQARSDFLRQTVSRDAISNNVCAALTDTVNWQVFAQREVPVVVYLNGEYYGILNMKQDFDNDFLSRTYGIDGKSVSVIKGKKNGKEMWYKSESGTEQDITDWQDLCAYAAEHALTSDYDEAYRYVASKLDIDNAVQYLAVMTYLCNTDWPQNNVMLWRYTGDSGECVYTDGKWRFVIRDMDLCFALHDKASQTSSTTYSMADTDTFKRILTFYWDGNGYRYDESAGLYADVMGIQGLYDFLLRNDEFRIKLRNCAEYLMSEEFSSLCKTETQEYFDLLNPEMQKFIKTWQKAGSVSNDLTVSKWESNKNDIISFINDRPAYYLIYLNNALPHYE